MKRIFSLVFAVLWISFCQAQKEKLELNLTKGETYTLKITSQFSFDVPAHGKQIKSEGLMYSKINYHVVDKHDSIYEMEAKADSIIYKGNSFNFVMKCITILTVLYRMTVKICISKDL